MTNLAYSSTDSGLEVVIAFNGEAYCTQSSYSRWTGVPRTTINGRCQSFQLEKVKIECGETGRKTATLIPVNIVLNFLWKDCPEKLNTFIEIIKELTGQKLSLSTMAHSEKVKSEKTKKVKTYIYLFSNSQVLKLGYSTNPENRIKQLQRWEGELEVLNIVEGTLPQEKQLHSLLHQVGDSFGDEWYPIYRENEILNLMNSLDINKKTVLPEVLSLV